MRSRRVEGRQGQGVPSRGTARARRVELWHDETSHTSGEANHTSGEASRVHGEASHVHGKEYQRLTAVHNGNAW